jgi:predicted amidohydrolase
MTRIAILQSRTGIDPAANAQGLVDAIQEAASGGAEMLLTPEMSGLLDRDAQRARGHVKPEAEDRVLAACRDAAARSGIWLHLGSLAVAAAQCGEHEDGRKTYGHSLLVDPWGEIILDMGETVGLAFGDIDIGKIAEVRGRIPAIDHRRIIGEAQSR